MTCDGGRISSSKHRTERFFANRKMPPTGAAAALLLRAALLPWGLHWSFSVLFPQGRTSPLIPCLTHSSRPRLSIYDMVSSGRAPVLQGPSTEQRWVEFPVLASALDLEFAR